MSTPTGFGGRPGALLGTRLAILAAEGTDPDRYRRGRRYARDGAVGELDVQVGVVSAAVQGSRRTPYWVDVTVTAGRPGGPVVPAERDLRCRCSCPDDVAMCKHAVAVLLSLADAVQAEPELLARWRGVEPEALFAAPARPADEVAVRRAGPPEPDPLDDWFGVRGPSADPVTLPPLAGPPRPVTPVGAEGLAAEALDDARRTLRSIYG